jgi:hypothetical protein
VAVSVKTGLLAAHASSSSAAPPKAAELLKLVDRVIVFAQDGINGRRWPTGAGRNTHEARHLDADVRADGTLTRRGTFHQVVRADIPAAELAFYCVNTLGVTVSLPSKAAVTRPVRVVLDGSWLAIRYCGCWPASMQRAWEPSNPFDDWGSVSLQSSLHKAHEVSRNTEMRPSRNPGDQLSVPVSADMAASVQLGGENASAQLRQAGPAERLALEQLDLAEEHATENIGGAVRALFFEPK